MDFDFADFTMSTSNTLAIVLLSLCVALAERSTLDDYINTCMDGVSHKSKPGKEDELFQQVGFDVS